MKFQSISLFFLFIVLPVLLFTTATPILAAPATPSATPKMSTASATTNKIEDLKDRLATKVAELRQTSRKAIWGRVKSTSLTSFVVEVPGKDVKIDLVDEIKVIQYLKGKRTILTSEDIAVNDQVAVFGTYDATLDLLKAAVVLIQAPLPMRVSGTVTARDDAQFTLTLTTPEGQEYIIDIEKATKTLALDPSTPSLVKSGFSKIAVGSTVHVVGAPVPKKDRRISADRIVDLGNLSRPNAQTTLAVPTPTEVPASPSATPSKKSTL